MRRKRLPTSDMLLRDLHLARKTVLLGVYPEAIEMECGVPRNLVLLIKQQRIKNSTEEEL